MAGVNIIVHVIRAALRQRDHMVGGTQLARRDGLTPEATATVQLEQAIGVSGIAALALSELLLPGADVDTASRADDLLRGRADHAGYGAAHVHHLALGERIPVDQDHATDLDVRRPAAPGHLELEAVLARQPLDQSQQVVILGHWSTPRAAELALSIRRSA